ncbi:unnamed protein product [Arctia plantaginis]|uniref:Uncharacterized protein n=1 Tax=Arctia plantaginis TaxID=874455 RepID=A0A8S0YYV6_ARCPL|nr:unnamed protein product [Arctia plantaginis]
MTDAFSALKAQFEDVTVSLSHLNERMDELMLKLGAAGERLKYLEKQEAEVTTLQTTVTLLQNEIMGRKHNPICVTKSTVGIAVIASENVPHIVLVAAKKIGMELEGSVPSNLSAGAAKVLSTLGRRRVRPAVHIRLPTDLESLLLPSLTIEETKEGERNPAVAASIH